MELFSSLRQAGTATGAVVRALLFPREAGNTSKGQRRHKSCRGRKLSLSLWCWLWIASSLLKNSSTAYCLLDTQKHGNCSSVLLPLTQLFWSCLLKALQQFSKGHTFINILSRFFLYRKQREMQVKNEKQEREGKAPGACDGDSFQVLFRI